MAGFSILLRIVFDSTGGGGGDNTCRDRNSDAGGAALTLHQQVADEEDADPSLELVALQLEIGFQAGRCDVDLI